MRMSMLQEALALLELGWSVVPLRAGSKKPLIEPHARQHRLPLASEVERWLERWPDANLGVVTGAVSGLLVVDVDPLRGADSALRALQQQFGALPATPIVTSGGGGRHWYFRTAGQGVTSGSFRGIELHGEGSYVVAPPSLHLTGKRYVWSSERPSLRDRPAMAPRWLLDLARPGIPTFGERRLRAADRLPAGSVGTARPGLTVVRPLVAV